MDDYTTVWSGTDERLGVCAGLSTYQGNSPLSTARRGRPLLEKGDIRPMRTGASKVVPLKPRRTLPTPSKAFVKVSRWVWEA